MADDRPYCKLLDHTADLRILVTGSSCKNLFENAAAAMIQLMVTGLSGQEVTPLSLELEGQDLPDLMVRWLGEILYLFEGENRLAASSRILSITPSRLEAALTTVPYDRSIHEIQHEIKAVTYHQIEVLQKGGLWEARIIFDV